MNNFIDTKTRKEFFISRYTIGFKNGETIYLENGKQIKNPENGNVLDAIQLPPEKQGIGSILKSNNKQQLQKMLKERSHQHYKKEVEEVKMDMNKKLNE